MTRSASGLMLNSVGPEDACWATVSFSAAKRPTLTLTMFGARTPAVEITAPVEACRTP